MRTMGLALRQRERRNTATNINKENPNRRLSPGTPKLSVVINPRAAAAMSPMTESRRNRRTAAAQVGAYRLVSAGCGEKWGTGGRHNKSGVGAL